MIFRILLCAAIILCSQGGFNPAAAARAPVVLCIGDSITAGYGLRETDSFPARLQALLQDMGHEVRVVNAGVSGETSDGARTRLHWTLDATPPDAVILATGGNDILRGIDPAVTRTNLAFMTDALAAKGIPFLLSGIHPFGPGAGAAKPYQDLFADMARRHGKTRGFIFDPFLLAGAEKLLQPDGLHPTPAGADAIARRLAPLVTAMLRL